MTENKKDNEISLHYSGTFEKENTLTARTVGNALSHLQRIVDKAVMFSRRGVLKKSDVLPAIWYEDADLQVQDFKKGCVTIPLKGPLNENAISLLKGILHNPYQHAISEAPIVKYKLVENFETALNRAVNRIEVTTHTALIENVVESSRKYFAESVYRDFDNLISPLRSSKSKAADEISIDLTSDDETKTYEFNKERSKRFHEIVSQKQLGQVASFNGRLTGLEETNNKDFPYKGIFLSHASKNEHKLLIRNESSLNDLRPFVAAKQLPLTILASPIVAWGAFDIEKGDLVYLKMDELK